MQQYSGHERVASTGTAVVQVPADARARAETESFLIARRAYELLCLLGAEYDGRVLIVEPRSGEISQALRRQGFEGTCTALLRRGLPTMLGMEAHYARVLFYDWLDGAQRGFGRGAAPAMPPPVDGPYHLVIAPQLSRFLPADAVPRLLNAVRWLLVPHGYVLVSEPVQGKPFVVEATLARSGVLQAADAETVEDGWTRELNAFQVRSEEEGRKIGPLRRVTWAELRESEPLRTNLVETYRATFGGDEWREWVRCPACTRHFSRNEAEALQPAGRCTCAAAASLVPFHPPEAILAKLGNELAHEATSCCYLREEPDGAISAFAWGFVTESAPIVHVLEEGPAARATLAQQLHAYMREVGADPERARLYYHSELGVLRHSRSLSLGTALFHRALQFAADQGVTCVIGRTSLRSNAYPILIGLGMQVVYQYNEHDVARAGLTANGASPTAANDVRVLLGGSVPQMLRVLATESERRLALRIGRHLRAGRRREEGA